MTKKNPTPNETNSDGKDFWPAWMWAYGKTPLDILEVIGTLTTSAAIGILTIVTMVIGYQYEHAADQREAEAQQHEILVNYLDDITAYVDEKTEVEPTTNRFDSATSEQSQLNEVNEIDTIAIAKTLNVFRQLDATRKGLLLKFLYDLDLIKICDYNTSDAQSGCQITGQSGPNSDWNLEELKLEGLTHTGNRPMILPGIDLSSAILEEARLPRIDLSAANLDHVVFDNALLDMAQMGRARMKQTKFRDASLKEASFRRGYLLDADFRGSNLSGADFGDALLCGADLRGAKIDGETNFQGAFYTVEETQFPVNFEPTDHGMILVEEPPIDELASGDEPDNECERQYRVALAASEN